MNGAFYSLPYDLLNDFEPISPLIRPPVFLYARRTMPAKNLNELIDWLRANPDKASAGIAVTSLQLLAILFQKETRSRFALVPYRSGPPPSRT